jgi:sensor domain CHASE-containing protein
MSLLHFCSSFKDHSEDSVLTRKSKSPLLPIIIIIIINTVLTVVVQEQ